MYPASFADIPKKAPFGRGKSTWRTTPNLAGNIDFSAMLALPDLDRTLVLSRKYKFILHHHPLGDIYCWPPPFRFTAVAPEASENNQSLLSACQLRSLEDAFHAISYEPALPIHLSAEILDAFDPAAKYDIGFHNQSCSDSLIGVVFVAVIAA